MPFVQQLFVRNDSKKVTPVSEFNINYVPIFMIKCGMSISYFTLVSNAMSGIIQQWLQIFAEILIPVHVY